MAKAPVSFFDMIAAKKVGSFSASGATNKKNPVDKFLETLDQQIATLEKWDGKKALDYRALWFKPDATTADGIRLKWGRQPISINGVEFVLADNKDEALLIFKELRATIPGSDEIKKAIVDQANKRSASLSAARKK